MFIMKKHLRRRTFLRGVGATVALPLLDGMIPAFAGGSGKPVVRAAFVYFPHGAVMDEWTPPTEGRGFRGGRILEPLTPYRDKVTVVSGLGNRHARGPVHSITPGTWLTGYSPRTGEHPAGGGATVDQIAAVHIADDTPLRSIQVSTEEAKPLAAGAWEDGVWNEYGTTLSFSARAEPLRMETSPRALFDRLFACKQSAYSRPRASILDYVGADAAALSKRLGPLDRTALASYLEAVRNIERRIQGAESGTSDAFSDRLRLLFDIVVLAFRADITRVVSFMMASEASETIYSHLGVSESFHALSHHRAEPPKLEKLIRIQCYNASEFARFVGTLAALPDGDRTLLDSSAILFGSNMSNSYLHDHFPLPLAVVGGACGTLRGGQHVRYPNETSLSNLLVTLLHRVGVPVETVGDSTGECSAV